MDERRERIISILTDDFLVNRDYAEQAYDVMVKEMQSRWISVEDRLPEIPEGEYAVSVLAIEYDPVYAEITNGHGNSITNLSFNKDGFQTRYHGVKGGYRWGPTGDEVTHWIYKDSLLYSLPRPPKEGD